MTKDSKTQNEFWIEAYVVLLDYFKATFILYSENFMLLVFLKKNQAVMLASNEGGKALRVFKMFSKNSHPYFQVFVGSRNITKFKKYMVLC